MALQYVQTLEGPQPRRRVQLLGVFDPFVAHPWILGFGFITGAFLAMRKKRR